MVMRNGVARGEQASPLVVYVPDKRLHTVILTINVVALLTTTLILAFVVLPGFSEVSAFVRHTRGEQQIREERAYTLNKIMEDSRKRSLQQQAEMISRQEQLKTLTERNLQLADEIQRRLRVREEE